MSDPWAIRIIDHDDAVDPEQLLANPRNWHIHPRNQQKAMEDILAGIGWVSRVIVNRRTDFVVDGHMRVTLAISAGQNVPVDYVELSDEEEAAILATFDTIPMLAVVDPAMFARTMEDVPPLSESVASAIETAMKNPRKLKDGDGGGEPDRERDDTRTADGVPDVDRESFTFGYIHWGSTHVSCSGEAIKQLDRWYASYKAEHNGHDQGFAEWMVETLSEILG